MRDHAKPDGARPQSASPRVHNAPRRVPAGARLATPRAAANDMSGRVEIIQAWAPARIIDETPVGGLSKRVFDAVASGVALLVLLPLLLLIAAIVRLESEGPAIFKQERGGFRGKTFRIWKFRTMTVMENRGVVQAASKDCRFTRIGGFLRRSSLDELPQLVNVLIGDMSIIGPRPHAIEHDVQFEKVDPRYPARFDARPGVTGLAQVNGSRGPTETEEKIIARTGFDIEYVQAWSWARDLKILADTVKVLWRMDGAF